MMDKILDLMEERRKHKKNKLKYKRFKIIIRRKIKDAKEKAAVKRYAEIEILQSRYNSFNVHQKIKEVTGTLKNGIRNNLLMKMVWLLLINNKLKISGRNTWKSCSMTKDQANTILRIRL